MSLTDGIFANAIRGTLAEPAVHMVNFRVRSLVIGTMHLLTVSAGITAGQIKCKIDPSKLASGAAAVYSPGDKTIYGSKAEGFYADEKQTFVHECTHAVIHLMGLARGRTVKNLDNETAAYLAGAIYVVASRQMLNTPKRISPHSAAHTIVSKKGIGSSPTNAGSPIEFSDAELAPLTAAIRTDPLYKKDWNQDVVGRW